MFSLRAVLASASLLAVAVSQSQIGFTSTPFEIETGESFNITWGGGDGTGVTLVLRRGNPQDLSTIDTIQDNIEEDYYVWTASDDLESGDDYALQITQGQVGINYSGLFSIVNTSNGTSNGTTTSTASGNSTASITSMASASGTGTAMVRNSTFSTASLTSTNTHDFNDMTTSSTRSSATRTPSSESTTAPSNNAPVRAGSSAALILGIVAAVMLH